MSEVESSLWATYAAGERASRFMSLASMELSFFISMRAESLAVLMLEHWFVLGF